MKTIKPRRRTQKLRPQKAKQTFVFGLEKVPKQSWNKPVNPFLKGIA